VIDVAAGLKRHGLALPALALAALLKWHYSQASAGELRWILAPTSWLTGLVMHADFAFYPGEGYLSREHSVLVSPACAGVNFATIAFTSLVLAFGPQFAGWSRRLAWLGASCVLAYAATVLVNTLRISLSIAVAHLAAQKLGLTFQSVHRLIGIGVYVAGLFALCLMTQVWLSSRRATLLVSAPVGRGATLVVALGCYASVTLGIPLLRGAAHNPDYWSHAAPVSVLVGVVLALVFAARGRNWDDGRYARRSSEHSGRITS
jgi:exosortase K